MPKKKKFDVVKAVKLNARDRVGQPKPEKVIKSKKDKYEEKLKNMWKFFEDYDS